MDEYLKHEYALELAHHLVDHEQTDVTHERVDAWSPDDLYEWLEVGWEYEWINGSWVVVTAESGDVRVNDQPLPHKPKPVSPNQLILPLD